MAQKQMKKHLRKEGKGSVLCLSVLGKDQSIAKGHFLTTESILTLFSTVTNGVLIHGNPRKKEHREKIPFFS